MIDTSNLCGRFVFYIFASINALLYFGDYINTSLDFRI